jgi:ketosteroid isomerase-like protein
MNTTKEVLDNHLRCFGESDLNGILSDYAPMAILFTPDRPLVGVDAIRPLFEGLLAEFAKPGASFELKHQSIKDDYAYIEPLIESYIFGRLVNDNFMIYND